MTLEISLEARKSDQFMHANLATLPPPPRGVCQSHLTFTTRDYCGRKLFAGEDRCYWHSETRERYASEAVESYFGSGFTLRKAIEAEVAAGRSLELASLVAAPLHGSFLTPGCNLRDGIFVRANLKDARLSYSDMQSANFAFANLENAYLSECNISGARFVGTRLFNSKFRANSFAGVIGLNKENFRGLRWGCFPIHRMLEQYPDQCEKVYRALASYFSLEGLVDDASWAAYRSSVMKHRVLTRRLSATTLWVEELVPALMNDPEQVSKLTQYSKRRSLRFAAARIVAFIEWAKSFVLQVVVGYGEKPFRVLGNALFAILLYSLIYQGFGAINDRSFVSCLYFSAITFTTVGYGDFAPHGAFRLIAASEALVGILLCGLFLFCLGRRSVGRL